jgi:hypothetical protein
MVLKDDANIDQIVADLKSNGVEYVINGIDEWNEVLTLWETEEFINPDENGDCSTIEVWDNTVLAWDNEIDH